MDAQSLPSGLTIQSLREVVACLGRPMACVYRRMLKQVTFFVPRSGGEWLVVILYEENDVPSISLLRRHNRFGYEDRKLQGIRRRR